MSLYFQVNPKNPFKKNISELKDYTKEFENYLKKVRYYDRPSIIVMGMRGSGKTAQKFILAEMILKWKIFLHPVFLWWKAPDDWIDRLESYLPNYHKNLHKKVNNLLEIDEYREFDRILFMDEADRELGALTSNTKESRRFGKSMGLYRQEKIFFHGGSQIGFVTQQMKKQINFLIYLVNAPRFLEDSKDSFVSDHKEKIKKLAKKENRKYCYFTALDLNFRKENGDVIYEGRLTFNLNQWCPYWEKDSGQFDEEGNSIKIGKFLSNGYENVSLDSEYEDEKKLQDLMETVIKRFMEKYGNMDEKEVTNTFIKGWLDRKDRDTYYRIVKHIGRIVSQIRFILKSGEYHKQQQQEENQKQIEDLKSEEIDFNSLISRPEEDRKEEAIDDSIAAFIYNFILELDFAEIKITKSKSLKKEQLAEFLRAKESGYSIMDLYNSFHKKFHLSQDNIKTILREYKNTGINKKNEFRQGFLMERWWGYNYDGGKGEFGGQLQEEFNGEKEEKPDYRAIDGELFSIKRYDRDEVSRSFSQRRDFHPSYIRALVENRCFWRVYINDKYGYPNIRAYRTDPRNDPDKVFCSKKITEDCFTHPKQVWNYLHPDNLQIESSDEKIMNEEFEKVLNKEKEEEEKIDNMQNAKNLTEKIMNLYERDETKTLGEWYEEFFPEEYKKLKKKFGLE